MQETIHLIFKDEIMYYIIIPLIIPLFEWIKNWCDIKSKNRKMESWKIKYKRGDSFYNIATKTYQYMMVNLFVIQFIRFISSFQTGNNYSYMVFGFICIGTNIIILVYITKQPQTKIELLADKPIKLTLFGILFIIFSVFSLIRFFTQYQHIMTICCFVMLIIWSMILHKCTDMVFILDKSWADIYLNSTEIIKHIYTGSMEKKGNWIYVAKYVDEDCFERLHIKESEIMRIDYYGGPIIMIQNHRTQQCFYTDPSGLHKITYAFKN